MKCPRCGKENKPNVSFCEACGLKFEQNPAPKQIQPVRRPVNNVPPLNMNIPVQPPKKRGSLKIWQIILITVGSVFAGIGILLIFLIIVGLSMVGDNSESKRYDTKPTYSYSSRVEETTEPVTEEETTEETTVEPTTEEPTTEEPTKDPAEAEQEFKDDCSTISFEDLSRNPDKYKGNKYKFTGKVIQVSEGWFDTVDLRINVTKKENQYLEGDYYTDTIYATIVIPEGEDRILEDDVITIWGTCDGSYTYTAILGNSVTLPKIDIEYYELNN